MSQKQLKNKDIDFLKVYAQKKDPSKHASLIKALIIPLTTAFILLVVFAYFTWSNYSLENKIDDLQKQTAKIEDQVKNDPNLERYNSLQSLRSDLEKYTTLYANIISYPQITQGTFDQILVASGLDVNVTSFSYTRESQVISLQIEGNTASDTELFVRNLKDTKIFAKVTYSGYSKMEKTITSPTTDSNTKVNTTPNTNNTTENSTNTQQNSSTDPAKALLELLNKANQQNNTETKSTKTVYTATVLCTLK